MWGKGNRWRCCGARDALTSRASWCVDKTLWVECVCFAVEGAVLVSSSEMTDVAGTSFGWSREELASRVDRAKAAQRKQSTIGEPEIMTMLLQMANWTDGENL